MKRLLFVALLAAAIFYAVLPGYSAYQIKEALDAGDASALSMRVDFDAVRDSLRPAITTSAETSIDAVAGKAGAAAANIYAALKAQMMPKIVDAVLKSSVTPETLIRVHRERGTLKQALDKLVALQVQKSGAAGGTGSSLDPTKILGGLFGKGTTPAETPAQPAQSSSGETRPGSKLTWRNIKGFGIDGPLDMHLSVAKNAESEDPDVTARMTFSNGSWVLTGLEPRL